MRYIIISFLLAASLFGLSEKQINVIKNIYQECSRYRANDGFTFENTCAAIALTESSAGKNIIGDQGDDPTILVQSSLGAMQIRVRTVLEVLKNFPELRKQYASLWHSDIDAINKYVIIIKKMHYYRYKMHHARSWKARHQYKALYEKQRADFKKYKNAYQKDLNIAEILLTDIRFSAKIAAHYLILNYQTAKDRHYWNPWWKAVSRYNGGWMNKSYADRVIKNIKIIRHLKRKRLLGS